MQARKLLRTPQSRHSRSLDCPPRDSILSRAQPLHHLDGAHSPTTLTAQRGCGPAPPSPPRPGLPSGPRVSPPPSHVQVPEEVEGCSAAILSLSPTTQVARAPSRVRPGRSDARPSRTLTPSALRTSGRLPASRRERGGVGRGGSRGPGGADGRRTT